MASRYMCSPIDSRMNAVYKILPYLKDTLGKDIYLKKKKKHKEGH